MSDPQGVFLSAVTSEFGRARDIVASDLRANQFDVTVQEDFRQEGGTTLDKLEVYIRERCQAVVCIIGERSGSVPSPASSAPYTHLLPAGMDRASYTQWEVIFALRYDKRVFIYQATPRYEPDQPEPTGDDHPELQARFVHWLIDELDRDRNNFSDTKDLQIGVLRNALLPVVGAMRSAAITDVGLDVAEVAGPKIRKRDSSEGRRLPTNRRPLVGRGDELDDLLGLLDDKLDQLVMLVGPAGVGKQALLRELARGDQLPPDFPDGAGVSPILTGHEDLDDLLQAIWEEFYDAPVPSTVVPRQRLKDLDGIEALIFVPNVDATADHIPDVLAAMPKAFFCVSAQEDRTRDLSGEEFPIDGLGDDEMLELFEDLYRSPVPETARPDVTALCVEAGGIPGRIELLAKDARKFARRQRGDGDAEPLLSWVAARSEIGGTMRSPTSESRMEDTALGAARAVGTDVPRDVLATVSGSSQAIDEAVDDGRLREGSPRYRLNPVLVSGQNTRATDADQDDLLDEVFTATLSWVRTATHLDIYQNRAFLLRMMRWGVRSGDRLADRAGPKGAERATSRWRDVIDVGVIAEPAMALGGRHGAWEQLLDCVEAAAQADLAHAPPVPDHACELEEQPDQARDGGSESTSDALGWAFHERGVRALLRDELADARAFMNASLRHRTNERGRELTRKVMTLVPLAVVPVAVMLLMPLFLAFNAIPMVLRLGDAEASATVDVTPDVWNAEREDTQEFEVRNVGDGSVWIENIVISHRRADNDAFTRVTLDSEDECREKYELPRDKRCTVTVSSNGTSGTAVLNIAVVARSGDRSGDQQVILVNTPSP